MLFTSASIISLLAVVPTAVQAIPVFSHQDGLTPRQAVDLQKELAVDPSQVATGSEQDGQGAVVTDNQVRSKTSFNNFANFCLTQNVPLTNGLQTKTGSCNPTIMGVIASTSNMPRSRFQFPKNGQVIQANTAFTLQMKIGNLQTGNFVNPNTNYYAAPQVVNGGGDIIGHSHVTIQKMDKFDNPNPLDPSVFAFFKGFNNIANNGVLTADVPAPGLPEGFYRMCSINTAANHQPVLVAVAQHGSLDDCVYFQCAAKASDTPFFNNAGGNNGGAGGNNGGAGGNNGNNGGNNGNNGGNNGNNGGNNGGKGGNNGGNNGNNGNNGVKGGASSSSAAASSSSSSAAPAATNAAGNNNNNGNKGGAQGNNGGANNNNKGQAAQQAADKAKQEADAKKAAEDQKKAQDAAKAAASANSKQAAAQQAADKAKQAADAKKAAEDQKKAQQQSNKGGKKNRRALRFQRD